MELLIFPSHTQNLQSTTSHILHLLKLCQLQQLPLILLFPSLLPLPPTSNPFSGPYQQMHPNPSFSLHYHDCHHLLRYHLPFLTDLLCRFPYHTTAALQSWALSIFHTTATHVLPPLTCKCKASLMVLFAVLQWLPFAVQLKSQFLDPPCKAVTCSATLRPLILGAAHITAVTLPFLTLKHAKIFLPQRPFALAHPSV